MPYVCNLCNHYFQHNSLSSEVYTPSDTSIVGHYESEKFQHCQIRRLVYRDYKCLDVSDNQTDMWLNNFLINICTGCIVGLNNKYTLLNCNVSDIILRTNKNSLEEAEIMTENEIRSIPFLKNTIIMPFNPGKAHWCLAIADTIKKTFTFLNPSCESDTRERHYMTRFLNSILKYNPTAKQKIPLEGWRILKIKHAVQRDGYNCGVYVLMFIQL